MKTIILTTLPLICFSLFAFGQQRNNSVKLKHRPVDIGLVYPVSTNGRKAAQFDNTVSFQAIAGVSGAVSGGAFAGIANIIKHNSDGAAIAGVINIIGGNARGAQFAGIGNLTSNETTGFQVAGIFNKSGDIKGAQLAGIFNQAKVATVQMAGIINIAHKVSGIQISGLVNVADSSDYPIGFINLIKDGEKSIGITTDENLNTMLSFYSGGRILYGIVGAGYGLKKNLNIFAVQGGVGSHLFHSGNHFRLNAEVLQLFQTDFKEGHSFTYALQILPEIKAGSRLLLFAGPSVNLQLDYSHGEISGQTAHHFWTTTGTNGHFIGANIGFTGGIKVIL